jgi:hypothetical protein
MRIAAVLCVALAQDQVDNPEYKGWVGIKPGSTVTYKVLKEGTKIDSEQKTTLKSIDDNEAVLETAITMGGKTAASRWSGRFPSSCRPPRDRRT